MIDLKALYYEKFLPFLVESYAKTIKAAKPGHCMKVTGLAMSELKTLIPMLRTVNPEISIFILSEDETGPDFIRASKLIEIRRLPFWFSFLQTVGHLRKTPMAMRRSRTCPQQS